MRSASDAVRPSLILVAMRSGMKCAEFDAFVTARDSSPVRLSTSGESPTGRGDLTAVRPIPFMQPVEAFPGFLKTARKKVRRDRKGRLTGRKVVNISPFTGCGA